MEKNRLNLEKLTFLIKEIERKNTEFENVVSNLDIYSRANMLKDISLNIINNNKLFQETQLEQNTIHLPIKRLEIDLVNKLIENTILEIQNNPSKKIIFLRGFLEILKDVSENDRNVILNSLKDKNNEEIKQELSNLVKIFKIKE